MRAFPDEGPKDPMEGAAKRMNRSQSRMQFCNSLGSVRGCAWANPGRQEESLKKLLSAIVLAAMALSWNSMAVAQASSDKTATAPAKSLDDQFLEAAQKGDAAAVSALLDKGAKVDAKSNDGTTAMMLAMKNSKTEAVNLLRDHGAQ